MKLIILASGKGSRLKNLTKNKPKSFIKIRGKSIIERVLENSKLFKQTIIVTGYKSSLISKKYTNYLTIKNKDYYKSNMVHSLFKTIKHINSDVIISYADVIYHKSIIKKLVKKKGTCIPLNKKWKKIWLKRMKYKEILNDAENVIIKKNKIIEIGTKIHNKFPKYQFMGIVKISKKDFFKMYNFYKSLKNINIDMTNFLNEFIKKKKVAIKMIEYNKYWFEIDNQKDLSVAKNSNFL
tara:strand:+ start:256 stop:969 length:714 start_codon:yes stop_codon:yes gene_type:complete